MADFTRIWRGSQLAPMTLWVVLGTLLLAWLSNLLRPPAVQVPPVLSLQAGLALALAYAKGMSAVPGITIGTFLSNVLFTPPSGVNTWFSIAAGGTLALAATLQAVLGGIWLRRSWPQLLWFRESDEFRLFYLVVTPVSCLIVPIVSWSVGLLQNTSSREVMINLYPVRLWLASVIGVYIVAPILILKWTDEPGLDQRRINRIMIPTLILMGVTILTSLTNQYLAESDSKQRMRNKTLMARSRLLLVLERHKEFLRGSQLQFMRIQEMSSEQFKLFANLALNRADGLKAVSWNPVINADEINTFQQRERTASHHQNFEIYELSEDGKKIPVKRRHIYVPIKYIEPIADNEQALGYDINSNRLRADAIQRAKQMRTLQATAAIRLVQSEGQKESLGVLMLQPVFLPQNFRKTNVNNVKGFLVAVYELDSLLKGIFYGPEWKGYHFQLMDHTPDSEQMILATYPDQEFLHRLREDKTASGNSYRQQRMEMEIGNRHWELQLTDVAGNIDSLPMNMVIVILQGGLLSTCILEGFLIWVTGAEQNSQRELQRKLRTSLTTAAMSHEIKQPLTSLLLNSRALQRIDQKYWYGRDHELHQLSIQIAKDAQKVDHVIGIIRDVLRSSITKSELVSISQLVEQAYLLVKADLVIKEAVFEYSFNDDGATIVGDRDQLILAIKNILKNSAEAIHPHGHLRVSTRRRRNWVDMMFCDDGPGFPDDVIKQWHLGLFSTKAGGSGIGLFLCSSAVQNNKGIMRLGRSKLGGAEVVLSFPQATRYRS